MRWYQKNPDKSLQNSSTKLVATMLLTGIRQKKANLSFALYEMLNIKAVDLFPPKVPRSTWKKYKKLKLKKKIKKKGKIPYSILTEPKSAKLCVNFCAFENVITVYGFLSPGHSFQNGILGLCPGLGCK